MLNTQALNQQVSGAKLPLVYSAESGCQVISISSQWGSNEDSAKYRACDDTNKHSIVQCSFLSSLSPFFAYLLSSMSLGILIQYVPAHSYPVCVVS